MAQSSIPRIPVVMFHSVGIPLPGWKWPTLTSPVGLFEKQINLLQSHGYRFLTMSDYPVNHGAPSNPGAKEVILTFDDGYLDNWVFAFPILKRMGLHGTIYVNPEFLDPSESPRLTLENVWSGECAMNDLQVHGFLNRAELRLMQQSGVIEIASHSMSHTWHWTGPEILGFHNPHQDRPWLGWNSRPERKFAYLTEDQTTFTPLGTPIYANGRSLGIRRFFPHPDQAAACIDFVAKNGNSEFFSRHNWRQELETVALRNSGQGTFENDKEMTSRFRYEILESQKTLSDITGHKVAHFCWPGGAYCDESWRIAEPLGYETTTVASWDHARWSLADSHLVHRIGCGLYIALRGVLYQTSNPLFLLMACEFQRGNTKIKWPLRFKKIMQAIQCGFKPAIRELP